MDSITHQWLAPLLIADKKTLWVVDEHFSELGMTVNGALQAITNRFDTAEALKANVAAHFCDFDFSIFDESSFEQIVYRISKEKPIAHHVINQSARLLVDGGELHLLGAKGEGIKGYIDRAAKLFGASKDYEKLSGDIWAGCIKFSRNHLDTSKALDDKQYSILREAISHRDTQFISKPGVFGWNKIDAGSAYLVENFTLFSADLKNFKQALDLGCGYGFLSCQLNSHFEHIVATDNNAAALSACAANFSTMNINGVVVPSDAGSELETNRFDLILCNPPFHSGFSTNSNLTHKFVQNASRLLSDQGVACFVTNLHIPTERIASQWFSDVEFVAQNAHFKLVRLTVPKKGENKPL
ncbi:MAG: methyltransferase [Pontibacterium sp.]